MKKRYLLIFVMLFFLFQLKGVSGGYCYDYGNKFTSNAYCYDNWGIHYNSCYGGSSVKDWFCDYFPYTRCNYLIQSCGSGYTCKNNKCEKSSTPPPSTCYCYYNGIDHHCGPDSCGKTNGCGRCTYPEYCGSDYQCHSPCTSHYTYKCYNNDVYWYNSCNQREGKKQECYSAGCSNNKCKTCGGTDPNACYSIQCAGTCIGKDGVVHHDTCPYGENDPRIKEWYCSVGNCYSLIKDCSTLGSNLVCRTNSWHYENPNHYAYCGVSACTSHYTYKCYNNDVYWYNSCNKRQDKKQECGTAGCINKKCCSSHYTYKCYNNDVYWYSSCNQRQDKKQECNTLGCSNNKCNTCTSHYTYKCYNNDVYWYNSCNQKEGKKQECGTAGCTNKKCCSSHYTYKCYNNDVYWYSSCNQRQDKKQECGTLGCSNNKCNTCTSHYTYKCYNNDVYWYNSCNQRENKKQECYSTGCSNNKCITCSQACSGHSNKCSNYDYSQHNPYESGGNCYFNWVSKGITSDCSSKCWCFDTKSCSSEECTSATKGCVTPHCFDHCLNLGYEQGECLISQQNTKCEASNCYYNFYKDTSKNFCTDNGKTGNCWCYDSEPCNDCGNSKECTQTGCHAKNSEPCTQNSDCSSNHCENGYCCDNGICCNNNNNCLLNEYCSTSNNCTKCPENSCGAEDVHNSKTCNPNQFGRFNDENHCSLICENEIDSKEACENCNSKYFISPVFSPSVLNNVNTEISLNKLSSDVKNKKACCLNPTDCVYNGICMPLGSRLDVDLDLREEICG